MNNPYEILNISSNATNEEIENARKRELKLKCSIDENIKDEKGEYLSDIINKAADSLLDPDKRRKIDEELNIKNVPSLHLDSNKQLPSIILTSINDELIKNNNKIIIRKKLFGKKVECNKLYIAILRNNECYYLIQEECYNTEHDVYEFCLTEYFTQTRLTHYYPESERPWYGMKIFKVSGCLAIAYPSYMLLPNSILKNGKVSEENLRKLFPIMRNAIKKDIKTIQKLFQEEEEKNKVYKK